MIYEINTLYIYTTALTLLSTDGGYFYHFSGTTFTDVNVTFTNVYVNVWVHLTNVKYRNFFESIVIFLLNFGYTKSNQEIYFKEEKQLIVQGYPEG